MVGMRGGRSVIVALMVMVIVSMFVIMWCVVSMIVPGWRSAGRFRAGFVGAMFRLDLHRGVIDGETLL